VVVGGSTGAGKSTLVNTIVGEVVSRTGVLRPTTRSAVLVHHPDDREAFASDRILGSLARVTGTAVAESAEDPSMLSLVSSTRLPSGVGILDTPDVDSVAAGNRELSRQLLAAADLWLFVTTPSRYADAVPWDLLAQAADRGTEVAVVLDRVERDELATVHPHLREMLDGAGLQRAALLVVPAAHDVDGMLPETTISTVMEHLGELAGTAEDRRAVADRTLRGALDSLEPRVEVVATGVSDQVAAVEELDSRVDAAHVNAVATMVAAIDEGRVLRGEVLARWHDFVGAGDLLRWLEQGIGRIRDRVSALLRRGARPEQPLTEAVEDGLVSVVVDAMERARRDTIRSWRSGPGEALVADLDTATPGSLQRDAHRLVQQWQDEVVELVRSQAGDKRASARVMALGLNGVAAVLMVAVFASTGGLTGAEVGVAAGTSVMAQRLLEAVLGDQAVRTMTQQAHAALVARVTALAEAQAEQFRTRLDALDVDPAWLSGLRDGVRGVEAARLEVGL
ncbi:MAG TPA: dynamin family protein, partial [Nitriliruptoraceae bacterium]|nr:dynamin family protein [Nitriliruptoraceae bacterium]